MFDGLDVADETKYEGTYTIEITVGIHETDHFPVESSTATLTFTLEPRISKKAYFSDKMKLLMSPYPDNQFYFTE